MKLDEICEGRVKNAAIDAEYDTTMAMPAYAVMVNSKVWKKDGIPVKFATKSSAIRAINTIAAKHGKIAQVIPYPKSSVNEASAESIEDALHDAFMKFPNFDYVRKHGPELAMDAIEYVANKNKGGIEPPDMAALIQEVIQFLRTPR